MLTLVALLLHLAIAVVLVRKYARTRDVGLVWPGVAVVVWPIVSRLLDLGSRYFRSIVHCCPVPGEYQKSVSNAGLRRQRAASDCSPAGAEGWPNTGI